MLLLPSREHLDAYVQKLKPLTLQQYKMRKDYYMKLSRRKMAKKRVHPKGFTKMDTLRLVATAYVETCINAGMVSGYVVVSYLLCSG